METSQTPTAREWLRGWTLTYIPNQDEAEYLAENLCNQLEMNGLSDLRLSDDVRAELERLMGTAQDENARSPAMVVEEILSDHLPSDIAKAAAAPLAFYNLNRGERTLEVDVKKKMPPTLATMIERMIRPKITEDGMARIQVVYDKLGPEGLQYWLLNSN